MSTPARELVLSAEEGAGSAGGSPAIRDADAAAAGGPPALPGHPVRLDLDDPAVRGVAAASLRNPPFEVIGHDLKRDALRLAARGIELGGRAFDVMIAAALTDPIAGDTLETLAAERLGARPAAIPRQRRGRGGRRERTAAARRAAARPAA